MAPSSARVNAPAALNSPPTTQTSTIGPIAGTSRATSAGTMKIPEPITHPTTTQNASIGPSTLGSVLSSTAEFASIMVVRFLGQKTEFSFQPGGRGLDWIEEIYPQMTRIYAN